MECKTETTKCLKLLGLPDEIIGNIFLFVEREAYSIPHECTPRSSFKIVALAKTCRRLYHLYIVQRLSILDFVGCPGSPSIAYQLHLCRTARSRLRSVRFAAEGTCKNNTAICSVADPFQPVLFDTLSLFCTEIRSVDLRFVCPHSLQNCAVSLRRMLLCCKHITSLDFGTLTQHMARVLIASLRPSEPSQVRSLQGLKHLGVHYHDFQMGFLQTLVWALDDRRLDSLILSGLIGKQTENMTAAFIRSSTVTSVESEFKVQIRRLYLAPVSDGYHEQRCGGRDISCNGEDQFTAFKFRDVNGSHLLSLCSSLIHEKWLWSDVQRDYTDRPCSTIIPSGHQTSVHFAHAAAR